MVVLELTHVSLNINRALLGFVSSTKRSGYARHLRGTIIGFLNECDFVRKFFGPAGPTQPRGTHLILLLA